MSNRIVRRDRRNARHGYGWVDREFLAHRDMATRRRGLAVFDGRVRLRQRRVPYTEHFGMVSVTTFPANFRPTPLRERLNTGRPCTHCGRVGHTYGSLNGAPLCHPNHGLDCYRLVTVYREPIGARLPGQPLHGAPDPIRSRTVPEAPFQEETR